MREEKVEQYEINEQQGETKFGESKKTVDTLLLIKSESSLYLFFYTFLWTEMTRNKKKTAWTIFGRIENDLMRDTGVGKKGKQFSRKSVCMILFLLAELAY